MLVHAFFVARVPIHEPLDDTAVAAALAGEEDSPAEEAVPVCSPSYEGIAADCAPEASEPEEELAEETDADGGSAADAEGWEPACDCCMGFGGDSPIPWLAAPCEEPGDSSPTSSGSGSKRQIGRAHV